MASQRGEVLNHVITGIALGTIGAHRCCKRVAGGWLQCTVSGEHVDGISRFDFVTGQIDCTFAVGGFSKIYSGAAILDAARLQTDANGKAITYAAGSGIFCVGQADQAVAATDTIFVGQHYPAGFVA